MLQPNPRDPKGTNALANTTPVTLVHSNYQLRVPDSIAALFASFDSAESATQRLLALGAGQRADSLYLTDTVNLEVVPALLSALAGPLTPPRIFYQAIRSANVALRDMLNNTPQSGEFLLLLAADLFIQLKATPLDDAKEGNLRGGIAVLLESYRHVTRDTQLSEDRMNFSISLVAKYPDPRLQSAIFKLAGLEEMNVAQWRRELLAKVAPQSRSMPELPALPVDKVAEALAIIQDSPWLHDPRGLLLNRLQRDGRLDVIFPVLAPEYLDEESGPMMTRDFLVDALSQVEGLRFEIHEDSLSLKTALKLLFSKRGETMRAVDSKLATINSFLRDPRAESLKNWLALNIGADEIPAETSAIINATLAELESMARRKGKTQIVQLVKEETKNAGADTPIVYFHPQLEPRYGSGRHEVDFNCSTRHEPDLIAIAGTVIPNLVHRLGKQLAVPNGTCFCVSSETVAQLEPLGLWRKIRTSGAVTRDYIVSFYDDDRHRDRRSVAEPSPSKTLSDLLSRLGV